MAQTCDRRSKITFCRPHSLFAPVTCLFPLPSTQGISNCRGRGLYVYQVTIGTSLRSQFKLSELITRVFSQNEYASYSCFIDIPRLKLARGSVRERMSYQQSPNNFYSVLQHREFGLISISSESCLGSIVGLPGSCACYPTFRSIG